MRQGSAWPWLKITKLHHPSSTTTCLCPKMGYPMIPWQFKCLSVSLSSLFSEFPWGRLHFEPCLRGTARRVLQLWWCFITDVLSFGTSRTPWLDPPSTHKMLLLYLIFLVLLQFFWGVFGGSKYFHRHNPLWSLSHLPRFAPLGSEAATPPAETIDQWRNMENTMEKLQCLSHFLEPFLEETEKLPVNFDPYQNTF